ncbi:Hypothetical protein CINCED_3A018643 [Cinara cedri]|uniref:Uncharacterized protein n=1 Tax=Cinara cedri TaxID=506608 RepID=A0A5E4NBT1_9HEMI|nr:Hypothetical protein CINCED_3A018643 [Cinara cedri]
MALLTAAAHARTPRTIEYRIRVRARTGKLAAPAPAKLQRSVASENTGHHLPLLTTRKTIPVSIRTADTAAVTAVGAAGCADRGEFPTDNRQTGGVCVAAKTDKKKPKAFGRPRDYAFYDPDFCCSIMDVLPSGNIFRELQDIHDTGYFSAHVSLEDHWQQKASKTGILIVVIL